MKISTITNAGIELLNGSLSNFTALRFQSLVIGSGTMNTVEEAKALTTVVNYKTKVPIETMANVNDVVKIESIISNKFVNPGYAIREIGLIALDAKDNEVMIWYINYDDEAGYLPSETSGNTNVKVTLNISLSELGFVEVDYVAESFATKDFVSHNFYSKIQIDDLLANFKGGVDIGPGEKQAYSGAAGIKLEVEKYDDALIDGNKLKLLAKGEVKKILTLPATGGGGGGATLLKLVKVNNPTVASFGSNLLLEFDFTSVDPTNSEPTGNGSCTLTVNSKRISSTNIPQGRNSLEVGPYLREGLNSITISVMDDYGSSKTIAYEIEAMVIEVRSSFDNNQIFNDSIVYRFTPIGTLSKTVHFKLNGTEIHTLETTIHNRELEYVIAKQAHGVHKLEVYLTADINGTQVTSKKLEYELICTVNGSTAILIGISEFTNTIKQYESAVVKYRVYDPTQSMSTVNIKVDDVIVSTIDINRTVQTFTRRMDHSGNKKITINSGSVNRDLNVTVTASSFNVEAETNGLFLYLTANGRNNNEATKDVWENNNIRAIMTGFNWFTNGWLLDKNNNTVLRLNGNAKVVIPFKPFAEDFRRTGRTIEIEFSSSNVEDIETVIMSCFDTKGFKITPQSIIFKSELSTLTTQYKEDERVRVSVVIQKSTTDRLLFLYINGEISSVYQYPNEDSFTQTSPLDITIEGLKSTIDIYNIRIYNNDLNQYQILNNYIADMDDLDKKISLYNSNQVFNASGDLDFNRLLDFIPILTFVGSLPQFKGDKKKCKIVYDDKLEPSNSFSAISVTNDVQGTSSQYYPRKNYKFKFDKTQGIIMSETLEKKTTYPLRADSIPVNCFCLKADFAESSGTHNTGIAKLMHDTLVELDILTPPQRKQKEAENRVNIRTTVDGFPILVFHKETEESNPTFLGKYNFNNDKSTEITFGFNNTEYPKCQSVEFLNNNSSRVTFNKSDYDEMLTDDKGNSYAAWIDDFEFRYPDDDVLNGEFESGVRKPVEFKRLTDWILAVKNDPNRFKSELSQYFDIDGLLYYHCMTEMFGMVDQRAKNMFATTWDGLKWWFIFYDNDTVLGLDNNGIIKFGTGIEYFDKQGDLPIWNDKALSALWVNVENTMKNEITEMYKRIRQVLTYDKVVTYLNTEQSDKWCESIYNEDSRYKYIEPLTKGVFDQVTGEWKKTGEYLERAQGSREEHRKWWLYNRFKYMDSKYNTGDYTADYITMRVNVPTPVENPSTPEEIESNRLIAETLAAVPSDPSFDLLSSIDQYLTVKYENTVVRKRAFKDKSTRLEAPSGFIFTDTNTIVYGASRLLDLGDIASKYPSYLTLGNATKVTNLSIGSAKAGYRNPNLRDLYLGNNTMLRTLDIRNCINLEKPLDLTGCTVLENLYATNTKITMVVLPSGGNMKVLHLPDSIVNLTLIGQEHLTDIVIQGYSNIQVLRLEISNGSIVNTTKILKDTLASATNLSKLRVLGLKEGDDITLAELDKIADTMIGIDENGFDTPNAVLEGSLAITVPNLDEVDVNKYKTKFPNLTIKWTDLSLFTVTDVTINTITGKKLSLTIGKTISGSVVVPDRFGKIIELGDFSNQSELTEIKLPASVTIMKINKNTYQGTGVTSITIDKNIVHLDISDSNITHINNVGGNNSVILDAYNNLETINIKNTSINIELKNCIKLKTVQYVSTVAKKVKLVGCPLVEFTSETITDYSLLDIHIENCPKYKCFIPLVHSNTSIGSITKLYIDGIQESVLIESIPTWLSTTENSKITLKGAITLEHSMELTDENKNSYQGKYPLLIMTWVEYRAKIGWVVTITDPSNDDIRVDVSNVYGTVIRDNKLDWGDGTIETFASDDINPTLRHNYSAAGKYTIKLLPDNKEATLSLGLNASKCTEVYLESGLKRIPDLMYKDTNVSEVTLTGIVEIGNSAFENTSLAAVHIPPTVTSIGSSAFYRSIFIKSVTGMNGLSSIPRYMASMTGIVNLVIPSNVITIETSAFSSCSDLVSLTLIDGLENIENLAFNACMALGSINIPSTVKHIGNYAFKDSNRFNKLPLVLPEGLLTIGEQAFFNTCVTDVTLPTTLTALGNSAFEETSYLKSINIPSTIETIPQTLLAKSGPVDVTIVEGVKFAKDRILENSAIRKIAFPTGFIGMATDTPNVGYLKNATKLQRVQLSSTMVNIPVDFAKGCVKLSSINMDDVARIGNDAFNGCSKLHYIKVGTKVKEIGSNFVYGANNVSVDVRSLTPPTFNTTQSAAYTFMIFVPKDKVNTYKSATGWSNYAEKILENDCIYIKSGSYLYTAGQLEITVSTTGYGAKINLGDGNGDQECAYGSRTFYRTINNGDSFSIMIKNASVVVDVLINNDKYSKSVSYVYIGPLLTRVPKNILMKAQFYRFDIQEGVTHLGSTNVELDAGSLVNSTVTRISSISLPSTLKHISKGFLNISTLTSIDSFAMEPPAISATPIVSDSPITLYVYDDVIEAYKASNWATAVSQIKGFSEQV